jgi:hypothetical protein
MRNRPLAATLCCLLSEVFQLLLRGQKRTHCFLSFLWSADTYIDVVTRMVLEKSIMRSLFISATILALTTTTATYASTPASQGGNVFTNPCNRGPMPRVPIINSSKTEFINFLQQERPTMPRETAVTISDELCFNMALVHNSEGLTHRLSQLLTEYGY